MHFVFLFNAPLHATLSLGPARGKRPSPLAPPSYTRRRAPCTRRGAGCASPPHTHMQRVKVYRLNGEGLWDDKGTGSVSVEFLEVCVWGRSGREGEGSRRASGPRSPLAHALCPGSTRPPHGAW